MLYSDLNSYTPTEKPLLLDIETIFQSLDNILSTRLGERIFNPAFGSEFEENLFELIDDLTAVEVYRVVIGSVEKYEPRVKIDYGTTVVQADPDNNQFVLILAFNLQGMGNTGQQLQYTRGIAA